MLIPEVSCERQTVHVRYATEGGCENGIGDYDKDTVVSLWSSPAVTLSFNNNVKWYFPLCLCSSDEM